MVRTALIACIALTSVAAADPQPTPSPATPAPSRTAPGASPTSTTLSNLVADAIKRKLDKVNANKGAPIELPPKGGTTTDGAVPSPASAAGTRTEFPMMGPGVNADQPGSLVTPTIPEAPAVPDAKMLTGGARMMIGAPTDGSPSYIRVAPEAAKQNADAAPVSPQNNPLARNTDPMEAGADSAAAASEPGANHNVLDVFVGTWDVTANFDTGPGQPPETASGTMVNSWALGGRWLRQEYDGKMTSLGAFRGMGFVGYDNLQKTYVATWMDTLSTACMSSKGSFDASTSTFTLTGDFSVPGGERYKQKQVMTVLSPDRYVVTMYLTGPDGTEFKTGNLEYTRSIKSVTSASTK